MSHSPSRRTFLERLGTTSAAIAGVAALPLLAEPAGATTPAGEWDMSWLEPLKRAAYRAVIDANTLEDGYAADLARGLIDTFQDVHGARDGDVGIVIVARRGGTPLVFDDALWEKYPVGEQTKLMDGAAPVRHNPYYHNTSGSSLETIRSRGVILLVCNVAANNWARSLAGITKRDVDEVRKDVLGNLVPGTRVMPSGVFSLMRAQNAGCAYMRGQ